MSRTLLRRTLIASLAGASSLLLAGGPAGASVTAPSVTPQGEDMLPVCADVHKADAVIYMALSSAGLCSADHDDGDHS